MADGGIRLASSVYSAYNLCWEPVAVACSHHYQVTAQEPPRVGAVAPVAAGDSAVASAVGYRVGTVQQLLLLIITVHGLLPLLLSSTITTIYSVQYLQYLQ